MRALIPTGEVLKTFDRPRYARRTEPTPEQIESARRNWRGPSILTRWLARRVSCR